MGIRNAKPTADREVVEEYIRHEHASQEDMDAAEGRQRWMKPIVREGSVRDRYICRIVDICGRFGIVFGLISYGNTAFSYLDVSSTVSYAWAGVRVTT